MATSPTTCYCAAPFSVDQCRTYRIFPSKNWSSPESTSSVSPSLVASPFYPAVLAPLGDFSVFSAELFFRLFDFVDFASLGNLSTASSLFGAKISGYLESHSGRKRYRFLERLHDGENLNQNLSKIRGLGLYLKRSSCLSPTRDRLPEFNNIASKLNCFTIWNMRCRKVGSGCHGLIYLGELFHTFIAGWEDAEVAIAFSYIQKNYGLRKLVERLSTCQPGDSSFIELQFRAFANKVFLRNGSLLTRDSAFWLTQILSDHSPKTQAYFLYLMFGPVGATTEGIPSIRWAEMGETTPSTAEVAKEWFGPLAGALHALYGSSESWTSRDVLTLMHEVTVLHGDTWLLENAACLLLECGPDMVENLLMSRVMSKKVADIGAWIAALSVAVVHLGDQSRTTLVLSVIKRVLLGLGNDTESRESLFNSISNTFQEFVVEYAELMTEDEERLKDLKKILRGQSYFQNGILNELANHLPSRRSVRGSRTSVKIED